MIAACATPQLKSTPLRDLANLAWAFAVQRQLDTQMMKGVGREVREGVDDEEERRIIEEGGERFVLGAFFWGGVLSRRACCCFLRQGVYIWPLSHAIRQGQRGEKMILVQDGIARHPTRVDTGVPGGL